MTKLEKLTQEEKIAVVNTIAPAYYVRGSAKFQQSLREKGIIGPGSGLTDLGKLLRQRLMDQMLDELL